MTLTRLVDAERARKLRLDDRMISSSREEPPTCMSCGLGIAMPGDSVCRQCDFEEAERDELNHCYADWGGGF